MACQRTFRTVFQLRTLLLVVGVIAVLVSGGAMYSRWQTGPRIAVGQVRELFEAELPLGKSWKF